MVSNQRLSRRNSLIGLVDIVNGDDGEVSVIAEVAERYSFSRLQSGMVDNGFGDIKTYGHAEEVAIGQT